MGDKKSMPLANIITDVELLRLSGIGNRKAQYQLHERHYGRMLGVAMRYAGSRENAEEIVSEAFIKIFDSADQFGGRGTVVGWMDKITFYTAIDYVRKFTRYKKVYFPGMVPDQPIHNLALANLAASELLALLQELPEGSRAVFSLYVVEEYTHPEIAELLGISVGTSKWHLNQARKKLRKALQQKNWKRY